jgi:hypothetical protein
VLVENPSVAASQYYIDALKIQSNKQLSLQQEEIFHLRLIAEQEEEPTEEEAQSYQKKNLGYGNTLELGNSLFRRCGAIIHTS